MGQCCTQDGNAEVIEAYDTKTPAYAAPAVTTLKQENFNAPPPMSEPEPLPAPVVAPEPEAPLIAPEPEPPVAAPAPAPEPPAPPKGPVVVLGFEVNGVPRTVDITEAPIGLSFSNDQPLKVMKVNPVGSGYKAGVQEGWIFTKVNDTDIRSLDYATAVATLKKGVEPLPKISGDKVLVLEFGTPQGPKQVAFTQRPLELTFDNVKMPVTVKKLTPGGYAERLGVQVGWTIQKGNGTDLMSRDFKGFMDFIKDSTKDLPEAKK